MPEKRLKTHQVKFRATEEFYQAIEKAARLDARSVASLIEKLLREHLRSVGINPDKPPQRDP
jgi:hypothetical protein